jgi:exopolysaccharide biosynthesis predicted pyruvyltransferase EpsI
MIALRQPSAPRPVALAGPWGHDFSPVAEVLSRFSGERVLFIPNLGNAGDSLHNLGALTLLDRLRLDYETGDDASDARGRVVVLGGGGSLVQPYRKLHRLIDRIAPAAAALVVLPQSVRAWPETLAALGPNAVVFARDLPSLGYLEAHLTRAWPGLSHDLAFMLDPEDFDSLRQPLTSYLDRTRLRRQLVRMIRMVALARARARGGAALLSAMRTDLEAAQGQVRPAENFDLAQMFAADDMAPWSCAVTARALRAAIAPYAAVQTDRLHVAILATLMRKQVRMLDNSYGKNSAVFAHSMRGRFANLTFLDRPATVTALAD